MNIKWHGQTCFRINAQGNKNGPVNILIDPFNENSGLRLPKLDADILLSSDGFRNGKKELSSTQGEQFSITIAGEYDIKGIYIQGILAKTFPSQRSSEKTGKKKEKKTIIFTIESEGIKLCHLGRLSEEELSPYQIEKIGEIDILMIPIGGGETLNAKGALKVMAQIEPKIIIPMYYQIPKLKLKIDDLNIFLKNLGIKSLQPLTKLSIKKKDISKEEAKIIVLEP